MSPTDKGGRHAALMVIDDEAALRRNIRIYFERRGYDIRCAGSAEEGLASLASRGADVVIMDCRLPGMDGVEAALQIRSVAPRTQVILMSGATPPCDLVRDRGAKLFRCVSKPVPLGELGKLVADALRGVHGFQGRVIPLRHWPPPDKGR